MYEDWTSEYAVTGTWNWCQVFEFWEVAQNQLLGSRYAMFWTWHEGYEDTMLADDNLVDTYICDHDASWMAGGNQGLILSGAQSYNWQKPGEWLDLSCEQKSNRICQDDRPPMTLISIQSQVMQLMVPMVKQPSGELRNQSNVGTGIFGAIGMTEMNDVDAQMNRIQAKSLFVITMVRAMWHQMRVVMYHGLGFLVQSCKYRSMKVLTKSVITGLDSKYCQGLVMLELSFKYGWWETCESLWFCDLWSLSVSLKVREHDALYWVSGASQIVGFTIEFVNVCQIPI